MIRFPELSEYLAEVEKITAEVKRLQKHYDRISTLNPKKYASDSEIDLAESNLKQVQASLEADNTSNVCSGANIV